MLQTSKAIDITGWDDERIASHFGLQRLVLVIKNLSQETIDAALAYGKRWCIVAREQFQSHQPAEDQGAPK